MTCGQKAKKRSGERAVSHQWITKPWARPWENLAALASCNVWPRSLKRRKTAHCQRIDAAELGAELTGRLLAFARRQPLSFSDIVLDMSDLRSRTLGEAIELNTMLANPLDETLVDPAQVKNALLNLAINARDGMHDRGKITIETSNVTLDEDYARDYADVRAGDYVLLSVTDTGIGMASEIREHVFEPFFTTKDVGRGTDSAWSMASSNSPAAIFASIAKAVMALPSVSIFHEQVTRTTLTRLPRPTRLCRRRGARPCW